MEPRFDRLIARARGAYDHDDAGHDFGHIQRVITSALAFAEAEGADKIIVGPAALLHDLVNVPKNNPDRVQASHLSAQAAEPLLLDAGYAGAEISQIQTAIIEHSFSLGRAPSTLESAVVQDADRLDALGAVGVMRAAVTGAALGSSLFDPDDPFAEQRALQGPQFVIDHFFDKLFKLPAMMNTAAARAEAERRVDFMKQFLDQLRSEVTG